ncbi:T9SS type A sorting domain-containing protein [Paracrocinitomix mangrovi]|uniref:T9SS type A sorting domain-containing protein n=1 Tax=Paracrocinitomix mangrovi TaxID=2862509 RepID=UPI001C8E9359|nr:T9SS type A sorting domain-containing protein [Paracrocinitomix mangrovi]UKN00962.1 T9SS type A sorting domain-containing protein [Paracrocinitomix mangrovi]
MIKKLLFGALTLINVGVLAQSTCTDPQGFLTPGISVQTFTSTGGYYEFQASSGCSYTFSHCQNGGSYTGDTYLTVTDDQNNTITSNDDWCGLGSELTWTAGFSGIARIHLGTCCGGTGTCGGGPTRVLAYWSTCESCTGAAPVTVIDPAPVCNSGDFTLMATSTDSLSWFSSANTSVAPLDGGPTYTTGTISTTTSYWVAAWDATNSCYGAPSEVVAEVHFPQTISFVGDTSFCSNGDSFTPNFLPAGGTVSGTGASGSTFDPIAAGVGTHLITYNLGDACASTGTQEFVVESAPSDATIYACEDSSVTVTGSGPGIGWFESQLTNAFVDTGAVINYTLTQDIILFYGDLPPSEFIDTITATNFVISDHDATTGDDRSGVAFSPNYFYVVGDGATGRIDLDFAGAWTALPIRDGIFSDISNGDLYTLWNGTAGPSGTYLGTDYTISHIAPMDEDLVINSGSAIALSTPIVVNNNSGDFGIFAGDGIVVIWTSQDENFYQIDLGTGFVTDLGTGTINAFSTENIAFWGVAEIYNGEISVSYRSDFGDYIERYSINSGNTMTVADFSGLSDLGCFTINPANDRMYFHHEGFSSSFGGSTETAGFCDAVWFTSAGGSTACRTAVPLVVSKPAFDLGLDSTICSNSPLTLDPGTWDTYTWSTSETTQTIDVAAVGTYDVVVTDSLGCPGFDTINIDVNVVTEVNLGSDVTVCNYQLVVLNAGGGYNSYTWYNGETSQLIYIGTDTLSIGNNTVTVSCVDNNGCVTTDNMDIIVEDCAGLDENEVLLFVYPNPVVDIVKIQLVNPGTDTQVQLVDVNGKLITQISNITQDLMQVDMSELADGVYFIRVINNKNVQDVKVIKQ